MKYLYTYECEKRQLSTPAELQVAIEGNRREGRRSSYGTYSEMVQRSPVPNLPPSHPSQMSPLSLVTSGRPAMNGNSNHHTTSHPAVHGHLGAGTQRAIICRPRNFGTMWYGSAVLQPLLPPRVIRLPFPLFLHFVFKLFLLPSRFAYFYIRFFLFLYLFRLNFLNFSLLLLSSHFVSSHFLVIYFLTFVFIASLICVFYFITLQEYGHLSKLAGLWVVQPSRWGSMPSRERLFHSLQTGSWPYSDS